MDNSENKERNNNFENIGALIQHYREKKNISIRELSSQTKIRIKIIEDIEKNNYSELPSRVYVTGFLKTICKVLEINEQEVLFLLDFSPVKKEQMYLKKVRMPFNFQIGHALYFKRNKKKISLVATIVFLVAVIISTVIFFKEVMPNYTRIANNTAEVQRKKTYSIVIKPKASVEIASKKVIESTQEEKVVLGLYAQKGDSWIAYKVDSNKIIKFVLKKNRSLKLEGRQIRIVVGNPAAIKFLKNGNDYAVNLNQENSALHLVFPEVLREKYKPPFFVFNNLDGTVLTKRQHEESLKEN